MYLVAVVVVVFAAVFALESSATFAEYLLLLLLLFLRFSVVTIRYTPRYGVQKCRPEVKFVRP